MPGLPHGRAPSPGAGGAAPGATPSAARARGPGTLVPGPDGPGGSAPLAEDAERAAIEHHLRRRGGRYVGRPSGDADVRLLRLSPRPAARLYWYEVRAGGAARTVVVKVPREPADAGSGAERPRLLEPPALETKYAREGRALEALQRHVEARGDPRFGAIPMLDRIDRARALVMGEVEGRPLKVLYRRLARAYPGRPDPLLRRAVENAGAWLRAYHGLELDGAATRQGSREEFVADVRRWCEHLGGVLSRPAFFDAVAGRLAAAADRLFPAELPVGLAHGDFAARNVLVGPEGRVVVFDTTAVWRAPVWADLAKFGLATRLSRVQVGSHGLAFREATLREVDRWLFAGYFGGEPVPEARIRLYGALLLLDKWSFELALPPGGSRLGRALRGGLLDASYRRRLRAMTADLGGRGGP